MSKLNELTEKSTIMNFRIVQDRLFKSDFDEFLLEGCENNE